MTSVIRCEGLTKRYRGVTALDGRSCSGTSTAWSNRAPADCPGGAEMRAVPPVLVIVGAGACLYAPAPAYAGAFTAGQGAVGDAPGAGAAAWLHRTGPLRDGRKRRRSTTRGRARTGTQPLIARKAQPAHRAAAHASAAG